MFAVLLLILPLVATLGSGVQEPKLVSDGTTGHKFIVAFPENIAHFYPAQPQNKVIITPLYPQTRVVIKESKHHEKTLNSLSPGVPQEVEVGAHLELSRSEVSNRSLQIISNKPITVHQVLLKQHSLQTSVATPTRKLATDYLIPPLPVTDGMGQSDQDRVTDHDLFHLVIVNSHQHSVVTLRGASSRNVSLLPRQVATIWLKPADALEAVSATAPVGVLLGHACAPLHSCTCAQLVAVLPPTTRGPQTFYIPPFLTKDAETKTYILMSTTASRQVKPANQVSAKLEAAGSAFLYRPGLLLPLTAEAEHGACFLLTSVPQVKNVAVIVVQGNLTVGVHLGRRSLETLDWQQLDGSDHVSAHVELESRESVIWHASSRMAVYSLTIKDGLVSGSPAAVVSRSADFRGCVLVPEVVRTGGVAGGWQESVQHCRDQNLELASFPTREQQAQVYHRLLREAGPGPRMDLWMGMRRSALTGQWYWLSNEPVTETDWAEPGRAHRAQCAMLSRESHTFGWREENCCREAHPVCYKEPTLLPV